MKINCLVADDEPLARKGLELFVAEYPALTLVASCRDGLQVLDALDKHDVQLMFLDIQMPKLTGLDLLRRHKNLPLSIITTAFPDHALAAYELDVIDYLLKPIAFERFEKAVVKAKEFLSHRDPVQRETAVADGYFFVKTENRYEKVYFDGLQYVRALQNYVVFATAEKKLISYLTIKAVEEFLPKERFVKVNKSHIVALDAITTVSGNAVNVGEQTFRIGRTDRSAVLERILGNKLLKRK